MISKSIQLKDQAQAAGKHLAKEIMISESIQAASSQLHLFILYAKKQGAECDLIQSAESVKAKLPVINEQLIRERILNVH